VKKRRPAETPFPAPARNHLAPASDAAHVARLAGGGIRNRKAHQQASRPDRARFRRVGRCSTGWLLSPFPLSSEAEERGMKSSGGVPRVALADSLTRGYFLKPLRGFRDGARNTPAPLSPPASAPPKRWTWGVPSATSSTRPTPSPRRRSR
jgi:hypothetical protein